MLAQLSARLHQERKDKAGWRSRLATPIEERLSEPQPRGRRPVLDPAAGELREVPIFWRADLAPGACIKGPAIIAEDETSTFITASFDARIDAAGCIVMERRG